MPCLVSLGVGVLLGKMLENNPDESDISSEQGENRESVARSGGYRFGSLDRTGKPTRSAVQKNDSGELVEGSSPEVVIPLDLLEKLSVRGGKRSLSVNILDHNDELVELLNISQKEQKQIKESWQYVRARIRSLESDRCQAKDLEDGSVLITVPDLSSDVRELGATFQEEIMSILGDNRGRVFSGIKQCDHLFTRTPGEVAYRVKVESVGDGRWRYHMAVNGADGNKTWVGETVPEQIRHLTDAARIVPNMNPENVEDEAE